MVAVYSLNHWVIILKMTTLKWNIPIIIGIMNYPMIQNGNRNSKRLEYDSPIIEENEKLMCEMLKAQLLY